MSIQMQPDEAHEVLGNEFCTDYMDNFGMWNTGFYCPSVEASDAVYCCGTSSYKYCCTSKDEKLASIPDFALMLGIVLGVTVVVVAIVLLSCFFCSCCLLYKRRHCNVNGGPLYQLHSSSAGSGVANMYSFSNQNSSATTPVETTSPHQLVDLDYHPSATNVTTVRHGRGVQDQPPSSGRSDSHMKTTQQSFAVIDQRRQQPYEEHHIVQIVEHDEEIAEALVKEEMKTPTVTDGEPPASPHESISPKSKIGSTSASPKPVPASPRKGIELMDDPGRSSSSTSGTNATSPTVDETLYWSTKF